MGYTTISPTRRVTRSLSASESESGGSGGGEGMALPEFSYDPISLQETIDTLLANTGRLGESQLAEYQRMLPAQSELALAIQNEFAPQFLASELGIMQGAMPGYVGMLTDAASQERQATLSDIERLTPQVNRIDTAARGPQNQAMYDELQRQTNEGLQAGANLTTKESRDVQQSQRSAEAARGVSGGSGSANREAVEMSLAGSSRQNQRQSQANSFLSLDNALRTDPFTAVGGMSTPATSTATSLVSNPGIETPIAGQQISGMNTALSALSGNTSQNAQALQAALGSLQAQQQALALQLQAEETAYQTGNNPLTGQRYTYNTGGNDGVGIGIANSTYR